MLKTKRSYLDRFYRVINLNQKNWKSGLEPRIKQIVISEALYEMLGRPSNIGPIKVTKEERLKGRKYCYIKETPVYGTARFQRT